MISYDDLLLINECVCYEAAENSVVINKNNLLSALSVQQWYEGDDRLLASALIRSITIAHGFQELEVHRYGLLI